MSVPALGPVWRGGKSVLDQDCTHITSGLGWPAFDDGWVEGREVIAPEDLVVTRDSSSVPGDAFYAQGASGLVYWFGHLAVAPRVGTRFRKGQTMGRIGHNTIGGGPHVHVAIDARPVLGRHLTGHSNYTHGAPTIGSQLRAFYASQVDTSVKAYWRWVQWYLGEGAFKGHKRDPRVRPNVPKRIPASWWTKLAAFLARRRK